MHKKLSALAPAALALVLSLPAVAPAHEFIVVPGDAAPEARRVTATILA